MRSIAGLWHWRGNPLRRGTDRVEGWLVLGAVLLIAVAAPAAALWGGRTAHGALMETVREQHRQRHQVWATVAETALAPAAEADPEPEPGYRVAATWTAVDGRTHSGLVTADRAAEPGDRLRIWTDAHGELTSPPLDPGTVSSYAALAGAGAATAAAGLVEALRRLVVRQLMARRYTRWEREWARVGPDWGRTGQSN